ncbi:DUF1381 domain-containing protein [Staphylococcus coagulans]|nr:DUF1381 domain-containing protein [Staphylococcus coagulans]
MTQYLITTFTDSTGQTFTVVEAESKEEALSKYEEGKSEN